MCNAEAKSDLSLWVLMFASQKWFADPGPNLPAMGCPLQRSMYLQPPALRTLLGLCVTSRPHLWTQNRTDPRCSQSCVLSWVPTIELVPTSAGASKGEKLLCLWAWGSSKGASEKLFLDRQTACGSFACKAEAEVLKPLGFCSLALLAGSSHAHRNNLSVRKIKRQISNEPETLSVGSSFPNHYADNYCPEYPQIRLINQTPAFPLE